jgi:hypothetical protein
MMLRVCMHFAPAVTRLGYGNSDGAKHLIAQIVHGSDTTCVVQ